MNHKARRIIEQLACERRYGIADEKGAEYSGAGSTYKETGADTLHNFKSVAARTGVTPEQTLMTYLLKHMDSINTAIKEAAGCAGPPYGDGLTPRDVYAKGEGIVSRLDDARNYLDLLECLLVDLSHIENPAEYANTDEVVGNVTITRGESVMEQIRRLSGTGIEPEGIVGFDGVARPRSAPEGTEIIPPLCWGETGEL